MLADGARPSVLDRAAPGAGIVDRLLLDRRLLGPAREGLFACDVTPRAMKHLRGVAQPGDRIVFERAARLAPDRICAVRHGAGLVLSRVLTNGRSLLLLPGEGESGFETIEMANENAVSDIGRRDPGAADPPLTVRRRRATPPASSTPRAGTPGARPPPAAPPRS